MLRKTLYVATPAFFRCESGDESDPALLQSKLATFLHTDRSKRKTQNSGANLKVRVEASKEFSSFIAVVLTFDIECGNDNVLLIFTHEGNQWRESGHWYSDKFIEQTDCTFGDFFVYALSAKAHPRRHHSLPSRTVILGVHRVLADLILISFSLQCRPRPSN